ncbi:MAG: hypothetical protein ACI9JN_000831 [Bacteroidia bacterium]
MKRIIAIAICTCLVHLAFSQNEAPEIPPKVIPEYHFNLSYTFVHPESIQHLEIGLNKDIINLYSNKVRLGLGVRAGIQDNFNVDFTSAHSSIKDNANNRDTLYHKRLQSASFNLYFNGEYHVSKHVSFGLNLDVLGVSTGLKTDATYRPGITSQQLGYTVVDDVETQPTAANAFSFGNSKGSLNTQLYAKIELSRKVAFRAGIGYLFQEFSTEKGYGANNSYRFEYNTAAFFAGITFHRFDEK